MIKVGTSGFSYKSWIGGIYPDNIKPSEMLYFYAQIFDAVEINSTFYHNPRPKTLERWYKVGVETGLTFVLKAHRLLTHFRNKSTKEIEEYINLLKTNMGDTLGGILWQFPSSFKPSEENKTYIESIAKIHQNINLPIFVELRNKGWHEIHIDNTITPVSYHMVAKSKYMHTPMHWLEKETVYIRLHGYGRRYGGSYPEDYLNRLCNDIKGKHGFVFFNNDADGFAPFNAQYLKNCIRQ